MSAIVLPDGFTREELLARYRTACLGEHPERAVYARGLCRVHYDRMRFELRPELRAKAIARGRATHRERGQR